MNFQIYPLTVRINRQINRFECMVEIVKTFGGMVKNIKTFGNKAELTIFCFPLFQYGGCGVL